MLDLEKKMTNRIDETKSDVSRSIMQAFDVGVFREQMESFFGQKISILERKFDDVYSTRSNLIDDEIQKTKRIFFEAEDKRALTEQTINDLEQNGKDVVALIKSIDGRIRDQSQQL